MRDESYMSTIFLISKYIDKYINISTVMYSGMKYNGAEKIVFLKKFVKWHHADLPITTIASDFM